MGVSPPAWGRRPVIDRRYPILGCIPTCVGQTTFRPLCPLSQPVYPHLRGADPAHSGLGYLSLGVSPPAWGRPLGRLALNRRSRCIPTCVGQTFGIAYPQVSRWVYPHLRGADNGICHTLTSQLGVSPPAWGRPKDVHDESDGHRCIPTCVGQTFSCKVCKLR